MVRSHLGSVDDVPLRRALEQASGWLTVNVRARRRACGLTQQELAEAVGIATTYVARIESAGDIVNPTLRLLVALARVLGCKPHELVKPAGTPELVRPGRPRRATRRAPRSPRSRSR